MAVNEIADRPTILFRCTTNTDLSQMAHGLLTDLGGEKYFRVESAGIDPLTKNGVSPAAIEAMNDIGIDLRPIPNNICKGCFEQVLFDYAISLSDDYFTECPHVDPEHTVRTMWSLPGLGNLDYGDPTILASARARLRTRLQMLLALVQQPGWFTEPKEKQANELQEIHQKALLQESNQPLDASVEAGKAVMDTGRSERDHEDTPGESPPQVARTEDELRAKLAAASHELWPTEEAFWEFIREDSANIQSIVERIHQREQPLTPKDLQALERNNKRAKELKDRALRGGGADKGRAQDPRNRTEPRTEPRKGNA